jgi:hypothetical protein
MMGLSHQVCCWKRPTLLSQPNHPKQSSLNHPSERFRKDQGRLFLMQKTMENHHLASSFEDQGQLKIDKSQGFQKI